MKGWPSEKEQVDELARKYWSFKEELSVENGLLMYPGLLYPQQSLVIFFAFMGGTFLKVSA